MNSQMKGWNGKILRVDLTEVTAVAEEYSEDFARLFVGGRGFAIKLLWDELAPGVDPLGPENMLIFATGPLTGHVIPNSGKMVVAAKSPITGGYGDGNLGSWASVNLRKAGLDAIVVTGRSEKPVYLHVENDEYSIEDASDLWGLDSYQAEAKLKERHGRAAGALLIGPSGENMCRVSTVVSQEGRAGGRPGMGAVMGSKNLKAVVLRGTKALPAHDIDELNRLGKKGYNIILEKQNYKWWKRQGTMAILEWCQEAETLPTYNFREGVFDMAETINGYSMENATVKQKGCPNCNMTCGNVVLNVDGAESELDYENVAMLGSNIGIGDLKQIATLNRMCDELGLDTIGAGACIAFAMEASEKGLIEEKISWGDFEGSRKLLNDLAYMRGLGATLGLGTKVAAEKIGGGASDFTIQVKGLECSAYDCHLCPGMALSFGTSPIGAHHKDAWVISWEISSGTRTEYNHEKADKVIEFQRIRGGMFESLVTCRFPWIELGFELDHYPDYFEAATGVETSLDEFWELGDRIYALIRAFWVREYKDAWSRKMDYPPKRWFDEPTTQGSLAGSSLDREKFDGLLQAYYDKRGWDDRGIPTKATMKRLALSSEATELAKHVELR